MGLILQRINIYINITNRYLRVYFYDFCVVCNTKDLTCLFYKCSVLALYLHELCFSFRKVFCFGPLLTRALFLFQESVLFWPFTYTSSVSLSGKCSVLALYLHELCFSFRKVFCFGPLLTRALFLFQESVLFWPFTYTSSVSLSGKCSVLALYLHELCFSFRKVFCFGPLLTRALFLFQESVLFWPFTYTSSVSLSGKCSVLALYLHELCFSFRKVFCFGPLLTRALFLFQESVLFWPFTYTSSVSLSGKCSVLALYLHELCFSFRKVFCFGPLLTRALFLFQESVLFWPFTYTSSVSLSGKCSVLALYLHELCFSFRKVFCFGPLLTRALFLFQDDRDRLQVPELPLHTVFCSRPHGTLAQEFRHLPGKSQPTFVSEKDSWP